MTSRSSSSSSKPMSSTSTTTVDQQKIAAAQSILDAFNSHDLKRADPYLADNFLSEVPGMPAPLNKSQVRDYNLGFLTAFPDIHFDVLRNIVQDDYVVQQWVGTGTHTGPMISPDGKTTLPPTNRRARVTGCSVTEIKQGKVTHSWVYWDMTSLLSQLGALPPI